MAIIKTLLLAAAVFASTVVAAPVAGLDARRLVIETVTETDWTTVGFTATVWVNDADPTSEAGLTTTAAEVAPTTAPAPVATTSAAPTVSPAGFVAAQPYTTPAPTTFSTSTGTSSAFASTTAIITQKDSTASTSGTCEGSGNACVGDVTHWDGGLGACGWNVDSNSDMAIALPYGFMGTQSNGNPYCGRSVTLLNPTTGTTVQATVGDKCMGCVDRSIDLTNALFAAIVPGGDGRVSGIQWWLN